ncbi:hypothetical protein [Amycolatopsis cihanbeyliensis]|uniref:Uncharacterized protein n=1 Tax=Amycolatopsis cihanbeyliensis TaxID=1128664 RepID=A0A542CTX9_AMYCI|nr:hypothetical protein [Amycolatopsis cihanbeyliensis]TQI94285.1 hypothetical protein FB471_6447 [Amycolatopsis cihanbeyliensis]
MSERGEADGRWAPWYVYVVPIVGVNLLKQQLVEDLPTVANVAVTAGIIGLLILVITAVYRSMPGNRQRQR